MSQIVTIDQARHTITQAMDSRRSQIEALLPPTLSYDRLLQLSVSAVAKSPQLRECAFGSILGAIIESAKIGLEPNTPLGHCYIIPFKGRAQLIPGYKGLVMLAHQSPKVITLEARTVYDGDEFDYSYGTDPHINHKPADVKWDERVPTHYYATSHLTADNKVKCVFEVMSKPEIDVIRMKAPAGQKGPWVTHYDEMAKKTVARRLCKWLPLHAAGQRAVNLDEMAEAGLPQDLEEVKVEAQMPEEEADEKKRRRLMILCREMKIDDDLRHRYCMARYDKKSSKDLTNNQLDDMIGVLADIQAGVRSMKEITDAASTV